MRRRTLICAYVGALVGILVLLAAVISPAWSQTTGKVSESRSRANIPADVVVTEAHIVLIRIVLNLRPEQASHWAPVEAALRDLARWQANTPGPELAGHSRDRAHGGTTVVRRLKRIAALARPLMKALDEDQRRDMLTLARAAGLEQLLASR